MKNGKPHEMSNEMLLRRERSLKVRIYLLIGLSVVLLVASILLAAQRNTFNLLGIIPFATLPIVIFSINALKEIKKEIKIRNL